MLKNNKFNNYNLQCENNLIIKRTTLITAMRITAISRTATTTIINNNNIDDRLIAVCTPYRKYT